MIKSMGIFSRPKKELLIAAFDIAGSSVGGLLFVHRSDKLPEILAVSRLPTDFFADVNFQKFQRALHKTFERVIADLNKKMPKGRKKPDASLIVFSSPYYVSQAKLVQSKKPKPFEITPRLLEKLIGEEADLFKKQWGAEHFPKTQNGESVEILEREIMKVSLNGYPVSKPIGKRAQNLEMTLYVSLGVKAINDKLKECISHSFGETSVRLQSFPFVSFNALSGIVDISKGLLLVDIGGEITDLVLIRNGVLEETNSFSLGENFLIRRIASVFHFPLEESSSLLSQYVRGDLHSDTYNKVKKVLEDAGGKWCEFFNESLRDSKEFSFIPQNRLLIGGKAAFALKDFIICTKEQPLTIQFLLPEAFKNHFIFRRGFGESKDISLMLSALFADKLFLNA